MDPTNAKTNVEYKGKNAAELALAGFTSNLWATYLQWQELGYKVKKGSKSHKILKVVEYEKNDNEKSDRAIRTYSVFNKEQVEKREAVNA